MNRWAKRLADSGFQSNWNDVLSKSRSLTVAGSSSVSAIEELARLKKAVVYIDNLLKAVDPDLFPQSALQQLESEGPSCLGHIDAFSGDSQESHLQNANDSLDRLLNLIRPHAIASGRAAKHLRDAVTAYSSALQEGQTTFLMHARKAAAALDGQLGQSSGAVQKIENYLEQMRVAAAELLGEEGKTGTLPELQQRIGDIEEKHEEVCGYWRELFEDSEGVRSKRSEVSSLVDQINKEAKEAVKVVKSSTLIVSELKGLEERMLGIGEEGEDRTGGVAKDVDDLLTKMSQFEEQQKVRYVTLNAQIESLLPGATSAGLASAYGSMRDSFLRPIRFAGTIFYGAVLLLAVGAVLMSVESISLDQGIKMVSIGDWEAVARSLLHKLPFYGPAIWLAYYASRRRSEYQRLQQEYAHKEALARSYDSYKKQIEDLKLSDNSMLIALMTKAIDAIAYNASATLDGRHGDKSPSLQGIEKLVEAVASKLKVQGLNIQAG